VGLTWYLPNLEHQQITPVKLENYIKTFDIEIDKLEGIKRGLLNQMDVQSNAKAEIFNNPEFDSNLAQLIKLVHVEKYKFRTLS
jgi:hypothetical protein